MTVFNVGQWLEKAIVSCINQTYKNIELILVEDCSTDNSKEIIDIYLKKDNRVRLIQNDVNKGAGASRKVGIENAKGDFVITIDGDDYIGEDFIEALVKRQEETDADIVGGGITIVKADGSYEIKSFGNSISEGLKKIYDYNDGKIIFLNNKLVRRTLYEIVPYCDRRYIEDTPVIIPLLYYCNKVAYVDNVGYYYLQRDNSLCHTTNNLKSGIYKGLCAVELLEFFRDKKDYKNIITIREVLRYLKMIKDSNPTVKDIEPYNKEFIELMLHVMNLIAM